MAQTCLSLSENGPMRRSYSPDGTGWPKELNESGDVTSQTDSALNGKERKKEGIAGVMEKLLQYGPQLKVIIVV